MYFGNSPKDMRSFFYSSWDKYKQKQRLSTLEQQLVSIILDHPEYHCIFDDPSQSETLLNSFTENPFLHLAMHLTIRDQITLKKPPEVSTIFHKLQQKHGDSHIVEHLLMEPLARYLIQLQQSTTPPSITDYVSACQELLS